MGESLRYSCPTCGSPLEWSAEQGKLVCPGCASEFQPSDFDKDTPWEEMGTYSCSACGAEITCSPETVATLCPYCGNHSILPARVSGVKKPDHIIPFTQTKDEALASLEDFCRPRYLLPKDFSDHSKLEEVQGVYVPFYLYNGRAEGSAEFACEWSDHSGNKTTHHTDYHTAQGSCEVKQVPVDASQGMPDAHMDSIEPYDMSRAVDFSTTYLPGYLASSPDVPRLDCDKRAKQRVGNTLLEELKDECMLQGHGVHYTDAHSVKQNISVEIEEPSYALLPVWMFTRQWNGKSYLFAVNGQTGRVTGTLPKDWKKFAITLAGVWLLAALLAFVGLFALTGHAENFLDHICQTWMVPVLVGGALLAQFRDARKQHTAQHYMTNHHTEAVDKKRRKR